jgi:hypothetical protein
LAGCLIQIKAEICYHFFGRKQDVHYGQLQLGGLNLFPISFETVDCKQNMKPPSNKSRPVNWNHPIIVKTVLRAAVIEIFLIAPLAIFGYGHAGANAPLFGELSLLLNFPGLMVATFLTDQTAEFSWPLLCIKIFLAQVCVLSCILFPFTLKKDN